MVMMKRAEGKHAESKLTSNINEEERNVICHRYITPLTTDFFF